VAGIPRHLFGVQTAMMDAYTHLDMSSPDPIEDLWSQMNSAKIDRALIVETWGKDNYVCLKHLIASPSPQFRIALCFRPEENSGLNILQQEMVAALRVRTADIRHLGGLVDRLESSGKWLLTHAEAGIKMLKDELLPLAKFHPELRIYLPHLGWPRKDKRDDKDWLDAISELSRLPNIIVGISAISHFSLEPYPHKDIESFAARLLDAFGADSVATGSDYPLLEKNSYSQYIRLAQLWVNRENAQRDCRFESNLFGNVTA
jgi:hypothetical protein